MALKTQEQNASTTETLEMDEGFASKLDNMLAGMLPNEQHKSSVKQVEEGMGIEEIMAQANDGIALAQTIEACILDCSQILLQMYNHIQTGLEQSLFKQVVFSNQLVYLKEALQQRVDNTTFNNVQVFEQMLPMQIPTSAHTEERLVLQIPKINSHEIGMPSWQTKAGVHTPHRTDNSVEYRFNQTLIAETDRIHLLIDGKDIVQEYLHDLSTTLQVVSSLINNAQLNTIASAAGGINQLTMQLSSTNSIYTGQLFVEQSLVSSEDSVAAISADDEAKALHAMQVISCATNMYADYRDQVNMVAEQIHNSVELLLNDGLPDAITLPLANAMVKDVTKMIEGNGIEAMLSKNTSLKTDA